MLSLRQYRGGSQRDKALSMLVETQREIVSLTLENERLKARLPAIDVSRIS